MQEHHRFLFLDLTALYKDFTVKWLFSFSKENIGVMSWLHTTAWFKLIFIGDCFSVSVVHVASKTRDALYCDVSTVGFITAACLSRVNIEAHYVYTFLFFLLLLLLSNMSVFGLPSQSPSINPVCVDLADWGATEAALQNIGPIDLLVNNAACAKLQSFLEVTPDQFDQWDKYEILSWNLDI